VLRDRTGWQAAWWIYAALLLAAALAWFGSRKTFLALSERRRKG
jgi:hypothetical protein